MEGVVLKMLRIPIAGIKRKQLLLALIILVLLALLFLFQHKTSLDRSAPADASFTNTVRSSVGVMDSLEVTRRGTAYRLHVFVDRNVHFTPVAIQLIDVTTDIPTKRERLYPKAPNSICPIDTRRMGYETKTLSQALYPYSNMRRVNLIVKVNEKRVLVKDLKIQGRCFEAIE